MARADTQIEEPAPAAAAAAVEPERPAQPEVSLGVRAFELTVSAGASLSFRADMNENSRRGSRSGDKRTSTSSIAETNSSAVRGA